MDSGGDLEFRAFGLKERRLSGLCQFFDNRTYILLSDLHFIYSVVFDEMFDLQSLVRRQVSKFHTTSPLV